LKCINITIIKNNYRENKIIMNIKNKIKIMIVDDHPIVRHGIIRIIESENRFSACCEAENKSEAVEKISECMPDLIIVDISLGDGSGIELIKDIKVKYPEIKMIVLSVYDEFLYAERVIRAGAMGYIKKTEACDNIIFAIKKVLSGGLYLNEKTKDRLIHKIFNKKAQTENSVIDQLSDRELEIFQFLTKGCKTKDIAEKINLSINTINTHYLHIKKKLNLKGHNELIQYANSWSHDNKNML